MGSRIQPMPMLPVHPLANGMPVLFEDEGIEMGESDLHTRTSDILFYGLKFHFAERPAYRIFSDLNVYFDSEKPHTYVSPDVMVVELPQPLSDDIASYQTPGDGPAPVLVGEVLSFRTYQQGDLTYKPLLYAQLGVAEYLLVDVTGEFLPARLLLKRRKADGTWTDRQDKDGRITSALGFRLILDPDGQLRVCDLRTGKRYARPNEAQAAEEGLVVEVRARRKAEQAARREAKARQEAEERIRTLEAELIRLRRKGRK